MLHDTKHYACARDHARTHIKTLKSALKELLTTGYTFTTQILQYALVEYARRLKLRKLDYREIYHRPCTCISDYISDHHRVDRSLPTITCPKMPYPNGDPRPTRCKRLRARKQARCVRRCRRLVKKCIKYIRSMEVGIVFLSRAETLLTGMDAASNGLSIAMPEERIRRQRHMLMWLRNLIWIALKASREEQCSIAMITVSEHDLSCFTTSSLTEQFRRTRGHVKHSGTSTKRCSDFRSCRMSDATATRV